MTQYQLAKLEALGLLMNHCLVAFALGFAVTLAVRHFMGAV